MVCHLLDDLSQNVTRTESMPKFSALVIPTSAGVQTNKVTKLPEHTDGERQNAQSKVILQ